MKTLTIAFKDLLIVTRDRSGFILMLVAPLALTLVVSFAFGGLGGGTGGTGLADIPVALVNLDEGSFSQILVAVFHSQDLEGLVEPVRMEDVNAARAALDADQLAAVVIIPPGFTESLTNAASETGASVVEVYANPTRPIGSGVIRSIVDTVLDRFVAGVAAGEVAIAQLVASGRIQPAEIALISQEIGQQAAAAARENELITVRGRIEGSDSTGFDFLNYMAPSMAILYLTFTMANAGRTLLTERDAGTLPRMLITPSRQASVLGGKLLGVYLTGVLQMAIVLVAGAFLFNISWGEPLPVILLTLALVGAASGWGVAIAAFARTPSQAGTTAMAINLIFAALAGNFIARNSYPEWLQTLGFITPNAWGIEGYWDLIYGGTLASALPGILALLGMTLVLFGAAVFAFRRQYG
jgi:ABC-2 type transport system permease protein